MTKINPFDLPEEERPKLDKSKGGQDVMGRIIDYENGDMCEGEVIDLFQDLVDTGLAWVLQGSYGRMAQELIETGYITLNKEEQHELRA